MNRLSLVVSLVFLVILLGIFSTGCSGLASSTTGSVTTAPSVTSQPGSQSVTAGQTATFSVSATCTAPLSSRCKKYGIAVNGVRSSAFMTPATRSSDNSQQ